MNLDVAVPWSPAFFELNGEYIAVDRHQGQHSWYVRGQNFVAVVSWAADGEVLREPAAPDEHAILVPAGSAVDVTSYRGERVVATGPALVVAPAGQVEVTVRRAGYVVRIFSARGEVAAKAVNHSTYSTANPRIVPLPPAPVAGPGGLRVVSLADVAEVPGRLGRIYRTDSLMINWFAPQDGPRDTDALSPHSHDDFEQASITVAGDYIHHIRRPWTRRMRDWRPDEHVQVTSPSVTLIPPGNVHTTRAVGRGRHQLIDVFAPPRSDFIERGWVLNQAEYEPPKEK
ncbi:hypothetical protein [Amycolatopsis pithecellobii]|uniref:Uncharacterized protein n=1 Tax=Amycolatopsis pithecellobii TaxID=664692 RepID=A0A6N7YKT6_9PSEU|nr:hypothetical protein [Amycolatopsis pithecellobii]MTD52498.1 hypothetical protein [Amycolatopsis pithecellobii]